MSKKSKLTRQEVGAEKAKPMRANIEGMEIDGDALLIYFRAEQVDGTLVLRVEAGEGSENNRHASAHTAGFPDFLEFIGERIFLRKAPILIVEILSECSAPPCLAVYVTNNREKFLVSILQAITFVELANLANMKFVIRIDRGMLNKRIQVTDGEPFDFLIHFRGDMHRVLVAMMQESANNNDFSDAARIRDALRDLSGREPVLSKT